MFPTHPSKLRLAFECIVLFGGTTAGTVLVCVLNTVH